jgi:hypothetical protein
MIKFRPFISIYNLDEAKDILNEVIWTFSSNLNGVGTARQRFNIDVVLSELQEIEHLTGSIKIVRRFFPIEDFVKKNDIDKRVMLLEFIAKCFLSVSNKLDWDELKILEARDKSIEQKGQFSYTSKKYRNKIKSLEATIRLDLEKDKVSIWIDFLETKSKKITSKKFFDTHETQVCWSQAFRNPMWFNNNSFGFKFSDGLWVSISPDDAEPIWVNESGKIGLYQKTMILYNANRPPDEFAKLANW